MFVRIAEQLWIDVSKIAAIRETPNGCSVLLSGVGPELQFEGITPDQLVEKLNSVIVKAHAPEPESELLLRSAGIVLPG